MSFSIRIMSSSFVSQVLTFFQRLAQELGNHNSNNCRGCEVDEWTDSLETLPFNREL